MVAATPSSGPAEMGTVNSAAAASSDDGSLVTATVSAPWRRASSRTATMSGERPDCEMPSTSALWRRGVAP